MTCKHSLVYLYKDGCWRCDSCDQKFAPEPSPETREKCGVTMKRCHCQDVGKGDLLTVCDDCQGVKKATEPHPADEGDTCYTCKNLGPGLCLRSLTGKKTPCNEKAFRTEVLDLFSRFHLYLITKLSSNESEALKEKIRDLRRFT